MARAQKGLIAKIPIVSANLTVDKVNQLLEQKAKEWETINYFYVINQRQSLIGVFSVKDLFRYPPQTPIKKLMKKDLVVSHPQVSQEKVAQLALKHNLKAIPIVDKKNRLLGVISSDKILAILNQEHRRRTLQGVGIVPHPAAFDNTLKQTVGRSFLLRAPWIVVGLLGGILAAQIIGAFTPTLEASLVLAAFIPLIVYISDAVGTQIQTLFVRDLALSFRLPLVKYGLKQLITTTLIALLCGSLVLGLVTVFWSSFYLGFVIGLATFWAIISSTFIALLVPYLLYRFGQDPATGSGPFATILQDLLSVFVYFLIASILL